jgi:hypothetical protein
MKAHLLYPDREFDWQWVLQAAALRDAARTGRRYQLPNFDLHSGLPWNAGALTTDLSLETVFTAMARGDDTIFVVARKIILASVKSDLKTIEYRQEIVKDSLDHPAVVRELYEIAVEANARRKGSYLGLLARYPDSVLREGIETMEALREFLKKIQAVAIRHGDEFSSEGWSAFFAMVKRDLDDEYLVSVENHLRDLRFRNGELVSAEIGKAGKGRRYLLHHVPNRRWTLWNWWIGLFAEKTPVYRFELAPRDEAGAQALQALRNRGISLAANALGQAADHVRDFFGMLRAELAFHVGCINLRELLVEKGEPSCFPAAAAAGKQLLSFEDLYDVALALSVDRRVTGNSTNADSKNLVIITGPNTGGKSTYLRSVGLSQLMMQSGMFVAATAFRASLCDGLFTHFKREEDAAMNSGKFDEELGRMSEIVDHVTRNSIILFNESFAATNEREGSEIARQIMSALLERGIRALCVTHLYELAHGFHKRNDGTALFLRADRRSDGARTFKLIEGEPLATSFGEDLYNSIFSASTARDAPIPHYAAEGGGQGD